MVTLMDNEKIYDLLEKMYAEIQSVKQGQTEMKTEISEIKTEISEIKTEMSEMKTEVKANQRAIFKIEDTIHNKVGILFDADTRTQSTLEEIKEEIKFIAHKESENEKNLFSIKNSLKVAK